jgi:hypothetical protein
VFELLLESGLASPFESSGDFLRRSATSAQSSKPDRTSGGFMADVLDDILTAFNQARHDLANDFDKMRADNMKFYQDNAQS